MSGAIGQRFITPNFFDVDATGLPYIGGQLYFYETGTSTLLDTYSDVGLTTPNTNPVVADASGHFGNIWLTPTTAYKVVLLNSNGQQIWSFDPVGPASGGASQNISGIIGEIRAFAIPAANLPAQWYACYGQALSRTTYASAFSVMGTTWGAGDGSTTFNMPDLRGRVLVGLDNMGGVAAQRITAGVSGVPGTTLGGTGGGQLAQQDTLTAVSTVSDPGHTHQLLNSLGNSGGTGNTVAGGTIRSVILTTQTATTGITVATTVTSALTGNTQNVQPSAIVVFGIYLGA